MAWSPDNAASAYLETIRLCKLDHQRRYTCSRHSEPHSTEFIAALAAGMNSKLILEVSPSAAPTTIALAVAARETGGRLICILSDSSALHDAMVAMKELNLSGVVEFVIGDAKEIVPRYANVDFALVDCKEEDYIGIMNCINLNSGCAVVVADNLMDRKATTAYGNFVKKRMGASSISLPIGKGIEVTRFSGAEQSKRPSKDAENIRCSDVARRLNKRDTVKTKKTGKVRFIIEAEEHNGGMDWF